MDARPKLMLSRKEREAKSKVHQNHNNVTTGAESETSQNPDNILPPVKPPKVEHLSVSDLETGNNPNNIYTKITDIAHSQKNHDRRANIYTSPIIIYYMMGL